MVCCYDLKGEYVVGDLRKQTLEEVWNSEEYQSVRYRINNAEKNPDAEPEICKNCLKWTLDDAVPITSVDKQSNGSSSLRVESEDLV